jgi:hypothetical protein
MLVSKDGGITWSLLVDDYAYYLASKVTNISIIVCGSTIADLKIFLGWTYYNSTAGWGGATVSSFQAEPFQLETTPIVEYSYSRMNITLCSDFPNPSQNSNPYSVAVLYCKPCFYDSLICISSTDGGINFNSRRTVALSPLNMRKVDLSYGYSPNWNTGRFYAAWDEFADTSAVQGHIYTARSDSILNNGFTPPFCLDSVDQTLINKCRNPVIATQFDNVSNDSLNLTSVVLFENHSSSTNSYDISGFYNRKAINTNDYVPFTLVNTGNNEMQPAISYSPGDTGFIVTYFNKEAHQLPYLKNDQNLTNPGLWDVVTQQYNDSPDISDPQPKIAVNDSLNTGMNVWISNSTSGKGIAMFDAESSTYTGIGNSTLTDTVNFKAYPNPCNTTLKVAFNLPRTETVKITLSNELGQPMHKVLDNSITEGQHVINIDVSSYPQGGYFLTFIDGDHAKTCKVFIVR